MVDTTRKQVRAPTVALTRAAVTGVLLCGGRSERMGRDKALERLHGRELIEYPLDTLREVAGRVLLASGKARRYEHLGCECVLDTFEDGGPLAGLLAGLEASGTEWIAVLACDMPRTDARTLRALIAECATRDLDACLLAVERGTQPMFAVYRKTCAPAIRAALEAGERRMIAFHHELAGGRALRIGSLRVTDASAALNLNTPGELHDEELAHGTSLQQESSR